MAASQYVRYPVKDGQIKDIGPYEAVVISHLDPFSMGALEVELLKVTKQNGVPERSGQLLTVRYLSPFYGVTPFKGLTPNDTYQNTQKSYGMWAIPPDPGAKVLVIFAEGHTAYGYWIGCIPEMGMNFNVPDPRASTINTTEATPSNLKGLKLPVGEYNKTIETGERVDPTLFSKPYNKDFTEILEVQGLLYDEARGTTTSSARRETPSMVFGISTPGPLDKRHDYPTTKYGTSEQKADVPYNRLGGSSFVMDDGDDKLVRATHPADGPPLYVNKEFGEAGGDVTIPQNECMRFRTRTGHQILLHNSEDLIYISNSRGTAWIELSSDGKIDIHAQDSISIMTNQDFNFSATRDINLEAGRNINMKASALWSDGQPTKNGIESGRIHIESEHNLNLVNGKGLSFNSGADLDFNVAGQLKLSSTGDMNIESGGSIYKKAASSVHEFAGGNWFRKVTSDIVDDASNLYTQIGNKINVTSGSDINEQTGGTKNTLAAQNINITASAGSFNASSKTDSNITSEANTNINSKGNILVTSAQIDLNGPTAPTASIASKADVGTTGNTPTAPTRAGAAGKLDTILLPYMIPGEKFPVLYESILCRAPQHEPWSHHENYNPLAFKPVETDREIPGDLAPVDRVLTPDTFLKNLSGLKNSVFVEGSGGVGGQSGTDDISYSRNGSPGNSTPPTGSGPLDTITTKNGLSTKVAAIFKETFQNFVDDLEASGYKINVLYGYANRNTIGGSVKSWHASGAAIDINPAQNGYRNPRVNPKPQPTDMPVDTVRRLCKKHGIGWGGDWNSASDAMHFSMARNEGGTFDLTRGVIPGFASDPANPPKEDELDAGSEGVDDADTTTNTGPQ